MPLAYVNCHGARGIAAGDGVICQCDARLSVRVSRAEEETLMLARRVTGAVVSAPEGERESELPESPWRTFELTAGVRGIAAGDGG